MLNLSTVLVFLLFAGMAAWLWHAHGLRERALDLVRQHCLRSDLLLLDDHVALRGIRLLPDALGRRRIARVYGFEFTVTGEQRHSGCITLFGRHLGGIQLAPHPFAERPQAAAPRLRMPPRVSSARKVMSSPLSGGGQVISLSDWRQRHSR